MKMKKIVNLRKTGSHHQDVRLITEDRRSFLNDEGEEDEEGKQQVVSCPWGREGTGRDGGESAKTEGGEKTFSRYLPQKVGCVRSHTKPGGVLS
jgi:hypothetical protein